MVNAFDVLSQLSCIGQQCGFLSIDMHVIWPHGFCECRWCQSSLARTWNKHKQPLNVNSERGVGNWKVDWSLSPSRYFITISQSSIGLWMRQSELNTSTRWSIRLFITQPPSRSGNRIVSFAIATNYALITVGYTRLSHCIKCVVGFEMWCACVVGCGVVCVSDIVSVS